MNSILYSRNVVLNMYMSTERKGASRVVTQVTTWLETVLTLVMLQESGMGVHSVPNSKVHLCVLVMNEITACKSALKTADMHM